jgi:ABC-type antimicrobial peptide transport system permease subunit
LASLGREISALDAGVAVLEIGSVQSFLKHAYFAEPQFILTTLGTFAGTGLLLAVIGIFSMMAYTVSLQTREIGIRMALGAQRNDVLRLVLKKGLVLITGGTLAGVVLGVSVSRIIASQIWGVSATDPWTYSAVVVVILVVGVAACLLPARRATQVSPLAALRSD